MVDRTCILTAIYAAVEDLNGLLPDEHHLDKTPETALFGPETALTSMNLVNLIVMVEQRVEAAFDRPVILADERAMARRQNPFVTIATLADFVAELLEADHV